MPNQTKNPNEKKIGIEKYLTFKSFDIDLSFGFRHLALIVIIFLCFAIYATQAADFSSTDFKVSAPVLNSGEYSTSDDFQLFGSISQIAIGSSTVSGAYEVVSGFLYFPEVTAPVPSATAGNGQVSLTWTAATAAQGWNIGGYNIGQSTAAGGPYAYSASLGNVTSSTRTGLTNGTTYYFVVRAEDTLGNSIATSSEVSATPQGQAADTTTTIGSVRGGISAAIFETVTDFIGRVADFVMGREYVCSTIGDINCDGIIDLADFSILAFWQQKPNPPVHVDLNGNGVVGLADFSIVAHYWTYPAPLEKKVVREDAQKGEMYTLLFTAPPDEHSVEDHIFSLFGDEPVAGRVVGEENDIARYQIPSTDVFAERANQKGEHYGIAALPAIPINRGMWIIVGVIMLGIGVLWKYKNF